MTQTIYCITVFFYISLLLLLSSCLDNSKDGKQDSTQNAVPMSTIEENTKHKPETRDILRRNTLIPYKELPIGSGDLFAHKFPDTWAMEGIGPDNKENMHENFIHKVANGLSKQYFSLPDIKVFTKEEMKKVSGHNSPMINHIKFKLPDFKGHEVYFAYKSEYKTGELHDIGSLIIFNRKTSQIDQVQIYEIHSVFAASSEKYFYIDKDYRIQTKVFEYDEIKVIHLGDSTIYLDQIIKSK